jgi:hypothetical protein
MLFEVAAEQNFPRKIPADAWFGFQGLRWFRSGGTVLPSTGRRDPDCLKLLDEAVA